MKECYKCGFNDEDYGCTCPPSDKWYACPIENKKLYFKIEDDVVLKYLPLPEIGENTYKTEVVMTKEIFQECYEKWIKSQESENEE